MYTLLTFKICYIIGFVIMFLYILYIIYKDKKIPQSISATVYSLDEKNKWFFTIVMFIVAFLITPYLFTITSKIGIEILAFLTSAGILGVGADPLIHGEKNVVHYVSAVLMGAASQVAIYLMLQPLMLLWMPYIVYTLYMENGKWNMFFAEIIMMIQLLLFGILA